MLMVGLFSKTHGIHIPQRSPPTSFLSLHYTISLSLSLKRMSTHLRCILIDMRVHVRIGFPSADGAKALLEPPVIKHEGLVPWWRYRDKKESLGVERWCPPDVEDGEVNPRLPLHASGQIQFT